MRAILSCIFNIESTVWRCLQKQKQLCGDQKDVIRDIYDGSEYQRHAASFIMQAANVSLTLNADGVSLFRSSKCSLWPVWLVVNELPPEQV